jgi:hypothetical protein
MTLALRSYPIRREKTNPTGPYSLVVEVPPAGLGRVAACSLRHFRGPQTDANRSEPRRKGR